MVKLPPTQNVEVDVEVEVWPIAVGPGRRADPLTAARRWWDASPTAVRARTEGEWPTAGRAATSMPALTGVTSFWRLVHVPGDRLGDVLDAWWRRGGHDDGRLSLGAPRAVERTWQLPGSLRLTSFARPIAVDLRLSPHARFWSVLELTPRTPLSPSRRYFRVGHDSLDRFVTSLARFS